MVGIPIKSTLDNATTVQYAGLISQLADKARSVVRELDPTNDMTFFRIRSKKHEIMVAPGICSSFPPHPVSTNIDAIFLSQTRSTC